MNNEVEVLVRVSGYVDGRASATTDMAVFYIFIFIICCHFGMTELH